MYLNIFHYGLFLLYSNIFNIINNFLNDQISHASLDNELANILAKDAVIVVLNKYFEDKGKPLSLAIANIMRDVTVMLLKPAKNRLIIKRIDSPYIPERFSPNVFMNMFIIDEELGPDVTDLISS